VYAILLKGRVVGSRERGRNENPWKDAHEGLPVSEEQYQERFWRRRLDGIGLDTATKEFLAIGFKRTRDARSNYVERATAVAQEQYTSLLTGLQAVGQVKGWKVQQIVFVGGTCGSIYVESFNRNMKDDDAFYLFLQKQKIALKPYTPPLVLPPTRREKKINTCDDVLTMTLMVQW
jgi:hypothetical protein